MDQNKEQIESAMAEMAVAQLSGRIPALFDHYVGFEIAEVEDDGARAFGLLGFAIRDLEVYVPAIYLGGRIKGTETMNLAATGKFVSSTRSWTDYLIEKARSSDLGFPDTPPQGSSGSSAALNVYRSPEYAFSGYKSASLQEFASRGYAAEGDKGELDVPRILKIAGMEAFEDFTRLASENSAIAEAMIRFYGERAFDVPEFTPKTASRKTAARKTAADLVGTAAPEPSKEDKEVKVVESVDDPAIKDLSDEQKVELATTGIAVLDSRDPEEKTRVIKVVQGVRTTNPNSTGIYQVLSAKTLKPVDAILSPSPFPIERPSNPMPGTLVIGVKGSKTWFWDYNGASGNLDKNRVVAIADTSDNASEKLAKRVASSGLKISSGKVGGTYVLVRKDGEKMSMPFKIKNKAGGRLMVSSSEFVDGPLNDCDTNLHRSYTHPQHKERADRRLEFYDCAPHQEGVWLETVDANGVAIVETGARLIVPSTWALLSVAYNSGGEVSYSEPEDGEGEDPGGIASAGEIEAATLSATPGRKSAGLPGYERLRVDNDGTGRVRIGWRGKTASWRRPAAAVHALVKVVGLGETDARSLVRKAAEEHSVFDGWAEPRGYHKSAYQIDIPWPDDIPSEGGHTEYSGTKITIPAQVAIRGNVEGYHDRSRDYDPALSNYNLISGQAGQSISGGGVDGIVSRAAQSGIKQVFDMAVASFLMRGGRLGIQIEEDILPYLEAGLDRACRLILRFYWNNDEFSAIYGADGMAEFEDIMLSNIKETGKAVLFLKRRSGGVMASYDDLNSLSEE